MCLKCDHIFQRRSVASEQRRCSEPACHSRNVMLLEDYEEIEFKVLKRMNGTFFGIVPVWDIGRVVGAKGMKLTDSFTLALIKKLHRDLKRKLEGKTIKQLFEEEERRRTSRVAVEG